MLERVERDVAGSAVVVYVSPRLARVGVRHAFSTRIGGVSGGPFASLNLGNPSGQSVQDSRENLAENYRRVLRAAGFDEGMAVCRVHQVHECGVVMVGRGVEHDPHAKADAIWSDDPSRVVSVRVADCVPVLLASADGSVVAAVHAGWRGVVAGIVPKAIHAVAGHGAESGVLGDIIAAIGPSIGVDAFEVGAEVAQAFCSVFGASVETLDFLRAGRVAGKFQVDLRAAVARQLIDAGMRKENIDGTDRCTVRDREEFFSHRRDNGLTGRMAAFIAPNPGFE